MLPETKYARLGGDRIAYQVVGDGPPDLVVTLFSFGHIDIAWEDPKATFELLTPQIAAAAARFASTSAASVGWISR